MRCRIDGCKNPIKSKSKQLCNSHYLRWRRHGDPLAGRAFVGNYMDWIEENKDYKGDECLIWPFGRTTYGYGRMSLNGRRDSAHVFILEITSGKRPHSESHARHLCNGGKDGCVNPRHLTWGTCLENAKDRILHGTVVRGEDHSFSRLSEAQVYAIKRRAADGSTHSVLAAEFGVARQTIGDIITGRTWAWLNVS